MNEVPTQEKPAHSRHLALTVAIVMLLAFGATMLIFSLLYVRDLRLLREVPEAIWGLICGVPSEDGLVLPILVLISTLSFLAAAALWGYHWLRASQ
jgi:hypothetical protein